LSNADKGAVGLIPALELASLTTVVGRKYCNLSDNTIYYYIDCCRKKA